MSIYTIGTILKEIRIEKGISQTDMCRGLCSKPMVSYIENEMRIPHRKLIESLFSRLGETLDLSKVPILNKEFGFAFDTEKLQTRKKI
ncbi:MAG: helix-turn-helix domain-containing protein [Treponema sp.]|nr:helix-turn-helix domain-containing protein [Treponema sp.]